MVKYLYFSFIFTVLSSNSIAYSMHCLSPQQERELLGKEFYDLLVIYNELESREFPCKQSLAICRKNLRYIAAHKKLCEKYQAKAVPRPLNDIAQEK